ncbi:unnamed protein product [Sympodiomycopsis kandeliae]
MWPRTSLSATSRARLHSGASTSALAFPLRRSIDWANEPPMWKEAVGNGGQGRYVGFTVAGVPFERPHQDLGKSARSSIRSSRIIRFLKLLPGLG